jgi:hypothetical protein
MPLDLERAKQGDQVAVLQGNLQPHKMAELQAAAIPMQVVAELDFHQLIDPQAAAVEQQLLEQMVFQVKLEQAVKVIY